jgi:transglutaminase-like putative cysteine protease
MRQGDFSYRVYVARQPLLGGLGVLARGTTEDRGIGVRRWPSSPTWRRTSVHPEHASGLGQTDPAPVSEYDLSMYLRPSRYAEADKFYGFAATEFGNYIDSTTLLEKVSVWVGTRLNYVPGSSDPIDRAVDTLLAGAGVCRDFAHLVVALLRAVNVPARVVSVYCMSTRTWPGTKLSRSGCRSFDPAGTRPGQRPALVSDDIHGISDTRF